MRPIRSLLWVAAMALSACASAPVAPDLAGAAPRLTAAQQRGHDFAVRRCSGCHTVGLDDGGAGEGPDSAGSRCATMRFSLERRFSEISAHGYDRMPPVSFTRAEPRTWSPTSRPCTATERRILAMTYRDCCCRPSPIPTPP
jgi:mono/diheme cytochrome c family protein